MKTNCKIYTAKQAYNAIVENGNKHNLSGCESLIEKIDFTYDGRLTWVEGGMYRNIPAEKVASQLGADKFEVVKVNHASGNESIAILIYNEEA